MNNNINNHRTEIKLFLTNTLLALVLGMVGACATNPIKIVAKAETTEQRAKAVYDVVKVYTQHAAVLMSDEKVPGEVKMAIKKLDAKTYPIMEKVSKDVLEIEKIRKAVMEGKDTVSKLMIVEANLEAWIKVLQNLVSEWSDVIKEVN